MLITCSRCGASMGHNPDTLMALATKAADHPPSWHAEEGRNESTHVRGSWEPVGKGRHRTVMRRGKADSLTWPTSRRTRPPSYESTVALFAAPGHGGSAAVRGGARAERDRLRPPQVAPQANPPKWVTKKPDASKAVKAVEDANEWRGLQGTTRSSPSSEWCASMTTGRALPSSPSLPNMATCHRMPAWRTRGPAHGRRRCRGEHAHHGGQHGARDHRLRAKGP